MTDTVLIQPDNLIAGGRLRPPGTEVLVKDGVVAELGTGLIATRKQRVTGTLLPGMIDLQVNGAHGRSVDEASPDALNQIARACRMGGAAAFLPTLITNDFSKLLDQTAAVAAWIRGGGPPDGSAPLGIHLEGPFLEVSGAHDDTCFIDPTPERVEALLAAADGQLALLTLAPCRPGAAAAVARLRAHGVAVSIGHVASTDGFGDCVAAGATLVTHLFNAMSPAHHREIGIASLALDEPRLSSSLIVDGVHVIPVAVRNAVRCLGLERTILVTDAASPMGMPDGDDYRLAGIPIQLRHGVVRDPQGRLAGSALTMAQAAHNFDQFAGPLFPEQTAAEVIAAIAARNPSRILGRADIGDIAVGQRAIMTRLSEGRYEVFAVD